MTLTRETLRKIEKLAYLETKDEEIPILHEEINAILEFVEQLQAKDTTNIAPLWHPSSLPQPLREDEVTEEACLAELAEIAPEFAENLYWVPKVIDEIK